MTKTDKLRTTSFALFLLSIAGAAYGFADGYYRYGAPDMVEYSQNLISVLIPVIVIAFVVIVDNRKEMKLSGWFKNLLSPLLYVLETALSTFTLLFAIDDETYNLGLLETMMVMIPVYVLYLVLLVPKYIPSFAIIRILSGKREFSETALKKNVIITSVIICLSAVAAGGMLGIAAIPFVVFTLAFTAVNSALLKAECP